VAQSSVDYVDSGLYGSGAEQVQGFLAGVSWTAALGIGRASFYRVLEAIDGAGTIPAMAAAGI
jgi:hypothetical protein